MIPSLLQSAAPEISNVSVWVIGMLCSFIGALLLILLSRVLKQSDANSDKLDKQGLSITEIKTTLNGEGGLVAKVNRMHDERNKAQARELEQSIMEHAELKQKYDELVADRGGDRRGTKTG